MLLNLHKKSWMDGLCLADYSEHCKMNESTVAEMLSLASSYNKVKVIADRFDHLRMQKTKVRARLNNIIIFFRLLRKKKK